MPVERQEAARAAAGDTRPPPPPRGHWPPPPPPAGRRGRRVPRRDPGAQEPVPGAVSTYTLKIWK